MTADQQQIRTGMMMGAGAALIWGGWPVVTALAVQESLSPYQLVLLRIMVSLPILLPFVFRGSNSIKEWAKAGVLTVFAGAPYSYLVSSGFQYSSATHGGVIIPGTIMLTGLLTSHFILKDRLSKQRILGGLAILFGLSLLASGGSSDSDSLLAGDFLFFMGGISWGIYTLLLRLWPMDAVAVTARVAFLSGIIMAIWFALHEGPAFENISTGTLVFQAIWQGALSGALAIILFNKGVALMGAAKATVVNSLIPVISTVLALVILHEIPNMLEAIGLLFILTGIGSALYNKRVTLSPVVDSSK